MRSSEGTQIILSGGYDPARFGWGLDLRWRIDAAIAPGVAPLQQQLTPLEVAKLEEFSSRFAEVHHPILA